MKLRIRDLYPFEPSVIKDLVEKDIQEFQRCASHIEAPTVVNVDGCWMVHNGNNRVYAAKAAGLAEIEVIDTTPADLDKLAAFRSRLRRAKKTKQQGFENVPIDETIEDRARRG